MVREIFYISILLFVSSCSASKSDQMLSKSEALNITKDATNSDEANMSVGSGLMADGNQKAGFRSVVTIRWKVPNQPIQGYIVNYGYSPENLEFHDRLNVKDIQMVSDPYHGRLFEHSIYAFDPTRTLFYTIQTLANGVLSAPSKVVSEKPVGKGSVGN